MARRSKAELEAAYAEKLVLFEVLWNWQKQFLTLPISEDIDPLMVAKQNREKFTPSQALSGLKQAINDILETVSDATAAEILDLNARLKVAGQPSFFELSNARARKVQRAIDAGKIKNLEEYYLISAFLSDVDIGFPTEQLGALNAILREYEARSSQ